MKFFAFFVFLFFGAEALGQRHHMQHESSVCNFSITDNFSIINCKNNRHVNQWVDYYSAWGDGGGDMRQILERFHYYGRSIETVLRFENVPDSLVYMVMKLSGFLPDAQAQDVRMQAAGFWLLRYTEAKRYNLEVNGLVDERRDFKLSTRVAAKHLRYLHRLFSDWTWSVAAYYWGEFKLIAYMQEHGNQDFWTLAEQEDFPVGVRNFVASVIAMGRIALNPKVYGFDKPDGDTLQYSSVALNGQTSLAAVARYLGFSEKDLKMLNPKFKTDHIPAEEHRKDYIRVPLFITI